MIIVGLPIAIYYFIVRPWRRERRITLDGMLLVACGLMFFQDPLLNYFNTWSTYNTWMWNRGSWVQDIPGWVSFGKPGRMMAEPLLMNAPGYSFGVLLCTMLGCWVMRKAKTRWPNISNLGLIGVVIVWTFFFDLVIEGLFLMPMGLFTYPGAIQALSINRRHLLPMADLRRADVGRRPGRSVLSALLHRRPWPDVRRAGTGQCPGRIREAATHPVPGDLRRVQRLLLRVLQHSRAVVRHASEPWPEDLLKRSYFMMGICGDGTDRLCPDPALPMTATGSGYINRDGQLVLPPGVQLPKIVPFERGK